MNKSKMKHKDNIGAVDTDPCFIEMINSYNNSQSKGMTSNYWTELNKKNICQLREEGYYNFKQTVGKNYFIWLGGIQDPKIRYLMDNLPFFSILFAVSKAFLSKRHPFFTLKQSLIYNFVSVMLWQYAARKASSEIIKSIEEPLEGNPPYIKMGRKRISQDLAYSALELNEIINGGVVFKNLSTVMELGAGYGRTAYVFLKTFPHLKYIIVDIPPALYISQRYLSSQFMDRKVFKFRDFKDYSEVAGEFEKSQIAFILPSQLKLIPDKTVDVFLAIDSLHEIRPKQIEDYFSSIDRLTKKFFYFKCWKQTKMPYDDIVLNEANYPVRKNWIKVFWKECKVLTLYFEALFKINNG